MSIQSIQSVSFNMHTIYLLFVILTDSQGYQTMHPVSNTKHNSMLECKVEKAQHRDIEGVNGVNKIADDLAKIQAIVNDSTMVICTSDRMLGDVGISLKGGIKAAFNSDVYSTIEQRQEYATKEALEINEHLESSLYPEYWVNGAAIKNVWVNANESYASDLSQLCGMILGLSVVNAA